MTWERWVLCSAGEETCVAKKSQLSERAIVLSVIGTIGGFGRSAKVLLSVRSRSQWAERLSALDGGGVFIMAPTEGWRGTRGRARLLSGVMRSSLPSEILISHVHLRRLRR